jgi:hypothetical protein
MLTALELTHIVAHKQEAAKSVCQMPIAQLITFVLILNVSTKMNCPKNIRKNVYTIAIVAVIGYASMANVMKDV